jgi:hypothetical protein
MQDLGHWTTNLSSVPDDAYGFIYLITNNTTNKKYIGKKQILSKRKLKPLKGKINKRSKIVQTDWKTYTSSSFDVQNDIKTYGKDKFSFEILRFCYSKSEMAYYEAKEQFATDALLSEDYYNGIVNLRISKIKTKKLDT